MYKVELTAIEATDAVALTQMQAKINTWITTGILKKYEIYTTNTHVVFNICKNKD